MWLLFVYVGLVQADPKFTYPPQKFAALGIERVQVEGVRGRLFLKGKPGRFFRAKVKHSKSRNSDDWHLVIERRQDQLHVEVFNVLYGAQWKRHVKQEMWPEFDVELEGPSRPLQVSWRDGTVQLQNWQAPVEASLLKGQMRIEGGTSRHAIQAVEAEVQLKDFVGEITLQGEKGALDVSDLRGQLDLNWLAGRIQLDRISGKVKVDTQDASIVSRGGGGEWELSVPKGSVKMESFQGLLKASGTSSVWSVSCQGHADVEVVTQDGSVDVRWLKGGTKLFLSSHRGEIRVPTPFKVEDRDGYQVVEGRQGEKPKGHLFVRTTSGPISFR